MYTVIPRKITKLSKRSQERNAKHMFNGGNKQKANNKIVN